MRSSIVLGIAAALIVGLAVAGWLMHKAAVPEGPAPATTTASAIPRDTGAMLVIEAKDGKVVTVPDFTYGHPSVEVEDTGVTYIYVTQNDDQVELDSRFGIIYASDSSISVGLFTGPLEASRQAAEAKLREFIPLPDAILCTLNVAVRAADTIDARYAGRELGLSFCPGAVPLP